MNLVIVLLTVSGLFFFIAGTVGILRMPDVFSRLHAATKCDTLGALLLSSALLVSAGINPGTLKLLFIIGFLWVTSPTAASVISSAAVGGEGEGISGKSGRSGRRKG